MQHWAFLQSTLATDSQAGSALTPLFTSRPLPDVNCTGHLMKSVRSRPEVGILDLGMGTPASAWQGSWLAWIWIPCARASAGMLPRVGNPPQKSDSLCRELKQGPFIAEIVSAERLSVEAEFESIGVCQ